MKDSRRAWRIACCYGVIFLGWASTFLYTPTLSTYASSLGASNTVIGLIASGFGLMLALLRAPLGILSDQLGKRKCIICASMLAVFACPLCMALWPAPENLVIFRFLSGVTPATWPILTVLVSGYFPDAQAPTVIARCNLFNSLGNVLGMLTGGLIVAALGQISAFLAASAIGLCAFALSLFLPEHMPGATKRHSMKQLLSAFRHKRLLFIAALTMIFQIVITGTSTSFTPVYAQSVGANAAQLGVLGMLSMAGMGIASALRNPVCNALKGVRNTMAACFSLLAASTIAIGFCSNIPLLYMIQLLQGTSGYMILVVLMGECIAPYSPEAKGAAMGAFQSIFSLGMCIGPFLSGILYDSLQATGVFLALGLLSALACGATLLYYQKADALDGAVV